MIVQSLPDKPLKYQFTLIRMVLSKVYSLAHLAAGLEFVDVKAGLLDVTNDNFGWTTIVSSLPAE
jgi:hypothetical protein